MERMLDLLVTIEVTTDKRITLETFSSLDEARDWVTTNTMCEELGIVWPEGEEGG